MRRHHQFLFWGRTRKRKRQKSETDVSRKEEGRNQAFPSHPLLYCWDFTISHVKSPILSHSTPTFTFPYFLHTLHINLRPNSFSKNMACPESKCHNCDSHLRQLLSIYLSLTLSVVSLWWYILHTILTFEKKTCNCKSENVIAVHIVRPRYILFW